MCVCVSRFVAYERNYNLIAAKNTIRRRLMNFRFCVFLKSAIKGLHHSCLVHFFNILPVTHPYAMELNVCEESPCKWPCHPSI